MRNCLLILLSTHHLQAQLQVNGEISAIRNFSVTDYANFSEFIRAVPCPAYLLTDLIEEDFRLETIPHLKGKNKRVYLQRKSAQFYPDTPFHFTTLQQQQNSGRHDDEMLFSALTNPNLIRPWLKILNEQKIPLAGIYSVAHISTFLIQSHIAKHLLVITFNQYSGLRQSYFKDQKLQLSRLTPISLEINFSDTVIAELNKTYQHLKTQGFLLAGLMLLVRIIASASELNLLKTHLLSNEAIHYEFIELSTLYQSNESSIGLEKSNSGTLFLRHLGQKEMPNQYANTEQLHIYSLWKLRRAIWQCSFIMLAISLLWTLQITFVSKSPDSKEITQIQLETQKTQQSRRDMIHDFPQLNIEVNDLKMAVLVLRQLRDHRVAAQQFLTPLSIVLAQYDDIQIDELAWQNGTGNNDFIKPLQTFEITLKTHREKKTEDYHSILTEQTEFIQALKNNGYQISILSDPLKLNSTDLFSSQGETSKTELLLKLIWEASYATQQK